MTHRRPLRASFVTPLVLLLGAGTLAPCATWAQGKKDADAGAVSLLPTDLEVRKHELTLGEETLRFTSTTGTLPLHGDDGEVRARVFFVAYTLDDVEDPTTRPLTFAFNGGPGSSSVWLHLGALGPWRVDMGAEGQAPVPPGGLVPNLGTWLGLTDLVFVDPVSTGYSRAIGKTKPSEFHGLGEDLGAVGEFIRVYTGESGRWSSPKFLAGESYGTTRAAGLANLLQDRHGLELNGIALISPVLSFQTIRFDLGNDLPYWLILPSYTATAAFHGRLAPELAQRDLADLLAEVEAFARTEYVVALALGDDLPAARAREIAERLARYTGLPVDFVAQARLRVDLSLFTKELLRDQSRTVGRLDSRYTGIDRRDVGSRFEYDPSYAAIQGPYTAGMNDYVRRVLGFSTRLPYEILTHRVHPWRYGVENRYVNVGDDLRVAMSRNRHLHVLVCAGRYDLATPYFAAEYTVDHLGLDRTLRANVTTEYYDSGHMMYLRRADLMKLQADAARFYARALRR